MKKKLPADKFIAAAAALSGRDPGELDEQEAIYILQVYGRDKPQGGDLYRQITSAAAGVLFSDPGKVQEWRAKLDGISDEYLTNTDLLPWALRRELAPLVIREAQRLYDELDESDPKREQLKTIMSNEALEPIPAMLDYTRDVADAIRDSVPGVSARELNFAFGLDALSPALSAVKTVIETQQEIYKAATKTALASTAIIEQMARDFQQMRELMQQIATINPLVPLYDEITGDLAPYMEAELKKPQYGGKTVNQLWDDAEAAGTDEGGYFPDDALIMRAYYAAVEEWERQEAAKTAVKEEPAAGAKNLPTVQYKPAENQQIHLNIDKLMRQLFNPRTARKMETQGIDLYIRDPKDGYKPKRGEIPGQLSFFPVSYEKAGREEITLYYALDYDSEMLKKLGIREETTAEDYFILSVIADAAVTGNTDVTANKLYKDFTGKEPNAEQRTQFVNRLMKMASTMVDIDDREVMQAWGQETYNQYYGQLAPLEFINERFVVNGGVANSRINIKSFPRVLQTGQKIGQYITVPKSLLYVKKGNRAARRTPRFYEILMILLKEIAQIKNGTRQNKILYSWLFKELGIDPKAREYYDAREDTLKTLFVILDHFKREKWITGYKEEPTKSTGEVGVRITWRDADGKSIADKRKAPKKRGEREKK